MRASRGFVIGILLIVFVLVVWSTWRSTEGFQTSTAAATAPTLLVSRSPPQIPLKEVFLVAPTDTLQNLRTPLDRTKAFTTQEAAAAKCASLGAQLATGDQLKRAYALGATWCAPGWVASPDDATKPIVMPIAMPGACGAEYGVVQPPPTTTPTTTPPPFRQIPILEKQTLAEAGGSAYPICYGVKPAAPAIDIVKFTPTQYGMLSEDDFIKISMGEAASIFPDTASLFPTAFSAAQVNYAFDKAYFSNPNPGAYSPRTIREWLVTNFLTVNSEIQAAADAADGVARDDPNAWPTDGAEIQRKACDLLGELVNGSATKPGVLGKLKELRDLFQAIQSGSRDAILAKFENSSFQARVASICRNETPATSPACARLAILDGAIFYGTDSKGEFALMRDLENLNYQLKLRECELQKVFGMIQRIQSILSCPENAEATKLFGTNPYLQPNDACPDKNTGQFNAGDALGYNNLEALKLALQEISPYYDAPGFRDLLNGVILRLSTVLRIPSFNDYADSAQNFRIIRQSIADIRALIPNIA